MFCPSFASSLTCGLGLDERCRDSLPRWRTLRMHVVAFDLHDCCLSSSKVRTVRTHLEMRALTRGALRARIESFLDRGNIHSFPPYLRRGGRWKIQAEDEPGDAAANYRRRAMNDASTACRGATKQRNGMSRKIQNRTRVAMLLADRLLAFARRHPLCRWTTIGG